MICYVLIPLALVGVIAIALVAYLAFALVSDARR